MFPPITDPTSTAKPSPVKRGALAAFRVLRVVQSAARSVPVVIATAGRDVADAWRETSRPNA
jgi:hypothetical protein